MEGSEPLPRVHERVLGVVGLLSPCRTGVVKSEP